MHWDSGTHDYNQLKARAELHVHPTTPTHSSLALRAAATIPDQPTIGTAKAVDVRIPKGAASK
jgi:hypothetical protein